MTESTLVQNNTRDAMDNAQVIGTPDTLEVTLGNRILVGPRSKILLLFHISASTNADKININAGANPPAFRGELGDYIYTFTGGAKELFLLLDTARFADDDGFIHITCPAHTSLAGTLEAYGI